MKKLSESAAFFLFLRYIFIVIVALPNLAIFYYIFTPLTVYPSYWLYSIFYSTTLIPPDAMIVSGIRIEIISACVAGAAYYLLLALNLLTPMSLTKRVKSILFLFGSFLLLNLLRILILGAWYIHGLAFFDITHEMTWYLGSSILVVALWFANIYIFKIKSIPFFSDASKIYKEMKSSRNSNKPKKKKQNTKKKAGKKKK